MAVAAELNGGAEPWSEGGALTGTEGRRVYAIGDIHGRDDLLARILARIDEDLIHWPGRDKPVLVFLGDYVDRGLQSRAVVDRLLDLAETGRFDLRFLKGNHESALLDFLDNPAGGAAWLSFGGAETLFSYGVRAPALNASADDLKLAARAFAAALPGAHLAFFKSLALSAQIGGFVFVHAGLRPGRMLEEQDENDLLTIRDAFLNSRKRWPYVVVHGHTPVDAVQVDDRRIAVDTGAYATGRLSAVRLDGDTIRVLNT